MPETFSHTPVRKKPTIDFSITGLVFCSMMMFMGLAAINSQANLLFGVFGLMIGVLLVSGIISKAVLRRLAVRRILPESATVGQPVVLTYEFLNLKRFWPSLSVGLAELDGVDAFTRQPSAYMLHAAPGMNAVVPIEVVPMRRGLHQLERYQISTSFPFGFIKRAVTGRQIDSFLVYPPLAHVDRHVLSLARSAEKTGPSMRPRRGGDDEFYGLKEYRRGESTRNIYWRRSARTGVIVSKEMTQVAPPRLLLLVDTYLNERTPTAHGNVERAIAMAASLASSALESDILVGVYAYTTEGFHHLPANRGKRQRRDILAFLAQLPLNVEHPSDELLAAAQPEFDPAITPILLTPQTGGTSTRPDQSRSGLVTLSATSDLTHAWFRFPGSIEFATVMPPDQEPKIETS
ncbi:MAG TPA: DUF58 domain-containing protein [Tepidisphaeraceae bacterium]|jgi:uncharacterized protein (DUF58 family)|nr:DUF58 domain-containing protein [Tepidisphaeraceae bacterium]